MEQTWLKYTLTVAKEAEDEFVASVLESPYTLGWVEPQIEVLTTDNGYDYAQNADAPVIAYLFEPLQGTLEEQVRRLESYLQQWKGAVVLREAEPVAEENESWKENFGEVRVGNWWVAPSWTEAEKLAGTERILRIDPGAAFGTGYHGTTQDLLLFLQEMPLEQKRVFDLGAGSGILSLFCALNGSATPVWAVDINQESEWQIKHNAGLNQLPEDAVKVVTGDALDPAVAAQLPEQADLILLNIGGDEDVAMLPLVKEKLADGGLVLLSGIVEWNREKVLAAYQREGFALLQERRSEEWVTLMMRHHPSSPAAG